MAMSVHHRPWRGELRNSQRGSAAARQSKVSCQKKTRNVNHHSRFSNKKKKNLPSITAFSPSSRDPAVRKPQEKSSTFHRSEARKLLRRGDEKKKIIIIIN